MVLDSWEGVSGVPGLGVSIPRPKAATISIHPFHDWEKKDKKKQKEKLKVGSKNVAKKVGEGIKVKIPRVLLNRSSSCNSGQSNISDSRANISTTKYSGSSDYGFLMPSPLPRVLASNTVRSNGGNQWRHLSGNHQRFQQKLVPNHLLFSTEMYPNTTSSETSHHQDQPRSLYTLTKSKSFKTIDHNSHFHCRFNIRGDSGPSSLPMDCNYYPCSSCDCCCDKHKPQKRVMFREVSPNCSSDSSSYSLMESKGVVGLKNKMTGKQLGDGSFKEVVQYGDMLHKKGEVYAGVSQKKGIGFPGEPHKEKKEYASISIFDSHIMTKQPYSAVPLDVSNHYKSPREVDGDYSYAYSDSISPAFLIRVGASKNYNNYSQNPSVNENIYEEINVGNKVQDDFDWGKRIDSSRYPNSSPGSSSLPSNTKLETIIDANKIKSSESLEKDEFKTDDSNQTLNSEKLKIWRIGSLNKAVDGFKNMAIPLNLDISKGEKMELINQKKRSGDDLECDGELTSSSMFRELEQVNRVMSQLQLDVQELILPIPCSNCPNGQEDSGFHSGGMFSLNKSSTNTTKKSLNSSISSCEEVKSGSIRKCDSLDFKNLQIKVPKNSLKYSLVNMDHTLDDLDHIVGVLKGDKLNPFYL